MNKDERNSINYTIVENSHLINKISESCFCNLTKNAKKNLGEHGYLVLPYCIASVASNIIYNRHAKGDVKLEDLLSNMFTMIEEGVLDIIKNEKYKSTISKVMKKYSKAIKNLAEH